MVDDCRGVQPTGTLQSAHHELRSLNEELRAVNREQQRRIEALTRLTDDLDSLLRSTGIGTVLVDEALRIRRFTPAIARVLDLRPADVGGPIDPIMHRIAHPTLLEGLAGCLESGLSA